MFAVVLLYFSLVDYDIVKILYQLIAQRYIHFCSP